MSFAFEVTEEDVQSVLESHWAKFEAQNGESFEDAASRIHNELGDEDFARVEKAALDAGVDMDDQVEAAHAELAAELQDKGYLKPSRRWANDLAPGQ